MSLSKYIELIRFNFQNSYYTGGICRDFQVRPLSETVTSMKNADLIMNRGEGSFSIHAPSDPDRGESFVSEMVNPEFYLLFWVDLKEQNFLNFTELPLSPKEGIYFFSNLDQNQNDLLHKEEAVSGADRMALRPLRFSYAFASDPNAAQPAEVKVVDRKGETVLTIREAETGLGKVSIDLKPYGAGRYSLSVNGQAEESFVAAHQGISEHPFALIELGNPGDIITSDGQCNAAGYTINFSARSTTWRYYVINRKPEPIGSSAVVDVQGKINFSGPENTSLPTGEEATAFTSGSPIALAQSPNYEFSLYDQYNAEVGIGNLLMEKLPAASPNQIVPEGNSPEQIFSEIYIYV